MNQVSPAKRIFFQISRTFKNMLEYQSRIWVIQVTDGKLKDETVIVNEDSFATPMQWMVSQGYCQDMLETVNNMKRSEIAILSISGLEHRIMRAK